MVIVIQLCPTLCDPMDYSPTGSSVHGILQTRILKWGAVKGRSTLRDPIGFLPLCAVSQGLSVPYQFLENRNEQSYSQFSGLRSWERAPAWIPFNDSLQWLSSVTLYLKNYPFCCNWWNFILFNGWVIILLKLHKHAFLQIKYPCFTQDLGPLHPSSHPLQSPGPSLWRPWQVAIPFSRDLPDPGTESQSPVLQADSLLSETYWHIIDTHSCVNLRWYFWCHIGKKISPRQISILFCFHIHFA